MKHFVILSMVLLLAGCGGGGKSKPNRGAPLRSAPMAFGPISKACMSSDRKARSRALCGCIQAVADKTLSGAQQRRAVKFYSDPHLAQETRQSDRANDERFWKAYKAYGNQAESTCR